MHVEFDLLIGSGTNAGDGFSFNYGLDATTTATQAEEGFGTGLSIVVDTFNNGGELVPNIGIKHGGIMLAEQVVLTVRSNALNRFAVDVALDGTLTLKFKGVTLTNVSLAGWQPLPEWQFSLGARTAAPHNDSHVIDNLLIGERASSMLLATDSPVITLALPPAFADLTNVVYSVADNSNPALATASVATNGWATIVPASNLLGSSVFMFNGTNATMNGLVSFSIQTVQPHIVSVAPGINGAAELQLFGPGRARFYLQESDTFTPAVWRTIALGTLNSNGAGTVSGLPFSSAAMAPIACCSSADELQPSPLLGNKLVV